MYHSTTLPPELGSVPVARHWSREVCIGAGVAAVMIDDVALIVTELVTNAIIHARSYVTLDLAIDMSEGGDARVRVSVADEDSRTPSLEPPDTGALGGRGLAIVRALVDQFGVEPSDIGKSVWCDVTGASSAAWARGDTVIDLTARRAEAAV
jgi:anti-sigma regulatory factor (Ser/Thr protein kinase)